jgi:regulator of sirC expression with transglutaminase-like and TPR domain
MGEAMEDLHRDLSEKDIAAFLHLLVEEQGSVEAVLRKELRRLMHEDPAALERGILNADLTIIRKTRLLQREIRWDELEERMRRYAQGVDPLDLEEGVFLLSTFEFPDLQRRSIGDPLDQMAHDLQEPVRRAMNAREINLVFSRYLFERQAFKPNVLHYYDTENSYFNRVVDKKTGIPITLSCLYLFLARRLDLKMDGVGLPGHFIVRLRGSEESILISPFDKGKVLSLEDCRQIVLNQGIAYDPKYLNPATSRMILARMIANLLRIYTHQGDAAKSAVMNRLFQLFQDEQ